MRTIKESKRAHEIALKIKEMGQVSYVSLARLTGDRAFDAKREVEELIKAGMSLECDYPRSVKHVPPYYMPITEPPVYVSIYRALMNTKRPMTARELVMCGVADNSKLIHPCYKDSILKHFGVKVKIELVERKPGGRKFRQWSIEQ